MELPPDVENFLQEYGLTIADNGGPDEVATAYWIENISEPDVGIFPHTLSPKFKLLAEVVCYVQWLLEDPNRPVDLGLLERAEKED